MMRMIFRRIYDFGRSLFTLDDDQQQRNNLLDTLMTRVGGYEDCLVDMKDNLQKHECDIRINQDTNLGLLNIIQEQCDLKFAKCDTRLSDLESRASKNTLEVRTANDALAAIMSEISDLKTRTATIADQLVVIEVQFNQQREIQERAAQLGNSKLENLIGEVHLLGGQLEQHLGRSNQFVVNLENYLKGCDQEIDFLRKEIEENMFTQQRNLELLDQVFAKAQAAGDERVSSLVKKQEKSLETLNSSVRALQDSVQKNKRELDNAVDIISKIDCIQSADIRNNEDVKRMMDELSKVNAKVFKMETQFKNHLIKVRDFIEEKNSSAIRNKEEQNQKEGRLQQEEVLMNLQQEIEELRKEKEKLAKEVKHLKQAWKSEKSDFAAVGRRLQDLEEASLATGASMKKIQEALPVMTSALLNRVDENILLQNHLTENRRTSDGKFEVMLNLIEPVMESINKGNDEKTGAKPLNSVLSEITQNWASELEKTVDEDFEKQSVLEKLVVSKMDRQRKYDEMPVLAHFGDALRLNLPLLADCASTPQKNVTRRVISSKAADEKRGAKCADRKYKGYRTSVAPAGTEIWQQQTPDYIKMNIRNAGRPREQC